MIIDMDWLECHSLMKVDWLNKWIVINHDGQPLHLHGLQHALPEFSMVEVIIMQDSAQFASSSCYVHTYLSIPVHQLLHSFDHLFVEPQGLPPSKSCDHNIPLVEGAQPVNVRPYMFSPAMKDEVEQQVKEMLSSGIIQPSHSAFPSPVLLLKKKIRHGDYVLIIGI
jgi:hypothetical protein